MKNLGLSVVVTVLLIAGCGPAKHLDDKLDWQKIGTVAANFPAAPQPGSKPIFLYFSQNNCHYCAAMDSLFERSEVAWYINEHFLPVNVNVDTDLPLYVGRDTLDYARLFKIFKMDGFPAYYFFDTTGHLMGMLERSMDLVHLKRSLVYVNDGHFGKLSWEDFLKLPDVPKDTVRGIF